ncbi:DUF11 domain-containing protein [Arthrobacter sp. ISL-48]|nr:DUF11 domain-containing protein [Arthrobacter sp. ISL-48]
MANTVPAFAAPVNEITARWADNTPAQVASGDVVTGEWRINVNDDATAPANAPVDNVTLDITLTNGVFERLPDACLTTGVTPASTLSADKKTLTCNLGTHNEGTAVALQVPVVVDGPTGAQVSATGTINGKSAALPPLNIVNPFAMDMRWGTGTPMYSQGDGGFLIDYEWTLSRALRSEAGPQTVTYNLNIASPQGGAISVDPKGCTPFQGPGAADGHPWSGGTHPANQMTSPATTCTITQTGPTTFQLTISGIDYAPANPPTLDSAGNRLPVDQMALTSGSIWVRVNTASQGSALLTSNAPTYTSTTGQTVQDDPSNNTESKAWTTPGIYSSGWGRGYTGSGGTTWDDTYRVAAGSTVGQYMDTALQLHTDRPDDRIVGMCTALDTKYVTFAGWSWGQPAAAGIGTTTEYYVGNDAHLDPASAGYDPNGFDCGSSSGWTTTGPADLTTVKAMRITGTQGQFEKFSNYPNLTPVVSQVIRPGTPAGTDVWSFFSGVMDAPLNNWWNATGCITPTPGSRYPCTTGFRDVLRVVTATPAIVKSVDRSVVTPGIPATYTLTYAANGSGAIPATVDGYQIVDTLPTGMTYVAASASPAPAVTTNGSGQQVLTWTLNGVGTNANHALTYQAVADSTVTPGQTLTNSATATYAGISRSASAQVTAATNGFTTIGKTADEAFIPNVNGDGSGAGSWTVTLRSADPTPQAFTDTIDILPYTGDGRGTSYSGSYALTGVTAVAGSTVYYTTADPGTLNDDPANAANGSAGNVTGNTAGWTTVQPANPTAVRVIGPALAPGATQAFKVSIQTTGAKGGDILVNRAQARAEHTELVMRTSAPISIANYYSASLKKYVQDAAGTWHDANTVEDYPAFRTGDQVNYRITMENTGQGTLTNVVVADDKYAAEGGFTIASLAPGATETHEFTITLGAGVASTFVNTASATADTPADSQIAATINADQAGIEVANYTTVKTSDPASGSTVVPGQKVTYTVAVTQTGSVPAAASFTDDLTKVLDDADYNNDAVASTGSVSVAGSGLSWNGTVPVGGKATITYSVTVKALPAGDQTLTNVVTSDGCVPVNGQTPDCTTTHPVGAYTVSKTSDPTSGSTVAPGQKITYTVHVKQTGPGALTAVTATDDLSKVLDDAAFNNDATASAGTATFDAMAKTLAWTGDLPVGADVTITYSVTVAPLGTGDGKIDNVITPTSPGGTCDTAVGCNTGQLVSELSVSKSVDPASGTTVSAGQTLAYTLTFKSTGQGASAVAFIDDLTDVLDDATITSAPVSSDPALRVTDITDGRFTVSGSVSAGQTVKVTYTAKVKEYADQGNHALGNFLDPVGSEGAGGARTCVTGNPLCTSNPVTTPAGLAYTGANVSGLALLALFALLGGGTILAFRRRRASM